MILRGVCLGALAACGLSAIGCLPSFDNGGAAPDMAAPAAADLAGAAPAVYFDPDVQADLDALGCTASACHGATASPVIAAMPSVVADWTTNYSDIRADCTTLDCIGGGASSLLLTKPLQGSIAHSGTKPFASTSDPVYRRWLAWIDAGAPFSAAGGPPAPPDMATPPGDMAGAETLTVTFTTTASPSAPNSQYDPKNVVAVWIESAGGTFVKTIGRWAATRKTKLVGWIAKAGSNDVDAVSGATNANYGTLTAKWNVVVPADGTYTIRMELADSNATQTTQNNEGTFTFNRNGTASTQTALSNGGFTNVSIVYSGR
jgi:hypothetical protein